MREQDKELLLQFVLSTSMYTGEVTQDRMIPFIHGYEVGTENQCQFTLRLRECLEEKYHYEYRALGWPYQVEQFAKKRRLSWVTAFKRLSLELINESNTSEFQQKLNVYIRKWIENRLGNLRIWFRQEWLEDWLGVYEIRQDWFGNLWSKDELKLLTQLNQEIHSIKRESKEHLKPTDRLLTISDQLAETLKRNAT